MTREDKADPIVDAERPELDLTGLKCPLPALRARKALRRLPPGATLSVLCTDPMAAIDIPHMAREEGGVILAQTRRGETLRFVIQSAARKRETTE